MTGDVLFSLACARIVASQAGRVVSLRRRSFGRLHVLVAVPVGFAIQGRSF